jgi:Flp pilus assembly protein TadG
MSKEFKYGVRHSGRRGNTMVEMALIFLPMLVMFFGILDVSMVVFLQNTLMHATREGARFAMTFSAAYDGNSCAASQAGCITQVVQANGFGFLNGTNANRITVNYYTANDLTNPVMACNPGCTLRGHLPQTLSNGTVVSYPNQPGNIVEVVVSNYPWNWLFPVSATSYSLTSPSVNLNASAVDILGGLPVGTTAPPTP